MAGNAITVTAGSKTVTGNLTQFVAAAGDLLSVNGLTVPIASCESTSSLTLLFPWPAATAANVTAWAILSLGPYWRSTVTVNQQITDLIAKINAGLPLRIGASGTLAARAPYDGQPVGFVYLQTDVAPQQVFVRTTAIAGSWSAPIVLSVTPAESTAQAEAARDVAVAARNVTTGARDAAASSASAGAGYRDQAGASASAAAGSAGAAATYRDSAAGYAASINPAQFVRNNDVTATGRALLTAADVPAARATLYTFPSVAFVAAGGSEGALPTSADFRLSIDFTAVAPTLHFVGSLAFEGGTAAAGTYCYGLLELYDITLGSLVAQGSISRFCHNGGQYNGSLHVAIARNGLTVGRTYRIWLKPWINTGQVIYPRDMTLTGINA